MKRLIFSVLLLMIFSLSAPAQSLFESAATDSTAVAKPQLELNGHVRGVAYGLGPRFDYTSVFGEIALKPKLSYGKTFLFADVRLREGSFFNENKTELELKEAYAGYRGEKFDFFLGNQIISWGRADGFNPTNNITPNNYFFLSDEPDDQKLSNFMARAKIRFTPQTELELIAIPFYRQSKYRYELFDMGPSVVFSPMAPIEKKIKNGSLAARLNVEGEKAGYSFSVFHGYDPFYGFAVQDFKLYPQPEFIYQPRAYKKTTLGADFAVPAGKWIFRGEAAYNFTRDYEKEMYIPNPSLNWVLGVERDFNGTTAILQYIGQYTHNFKPLTAPVLADPTNPMAQMEYAQNMLMHETRLYNRKIFNQQEKTNHALFLSLGRSFAYEAVRAEVSGLYNFTSKEYLIRPDVKWKITDALKLGVGANIMNGTKDYIFNKAGRVLNGGYLSLTVNF